MPVYFIPNRGQMDEQVDYYVQGKDKTVYFTDEGITFVLTKTKEKSDFERWVVKLDFVGANPDVHPVGMEETGAKISYFKGKPEEWKAGLPAYAKIVYRELWPGIDLVYYGTVNRLKYEFVVHPEADPSLIRLAYRGAESVSVDEAGRLQVKTPIGGFSDDVPVAYQEIADKRADVRLAYKIGEHNSEADMFGFEIGEYDRSMTLIIDPAIFVYCGFIGGSSWDYDSGITVDSTGCAYVAGWTWSSQSAFPVTVGPDLTFNGGYWDSFVAKVDASGTALVYCGYVGGSGEEYINDIAVDSAGCAYVTGSTESSEASFPVTVGPGLTYNGGGEYYPSDAFVAKVNASGTVLDFCGYIGGSGDEVGSGIAVDSAGCAYVTGSTESSEASFPVTVGPDLTYNGPGLYYGDAFVAKVSASGMALAYCGYIGGSDRDVGDDIAVDSAGCAYLIGYTYSTEASFPVKVGPSLTRHGWLWHFVTKVNAAGTGLVYCGYIGRQPTHYGDGHCIGIAVDSDGCAYVAGHEQWCDEIECQGYEYFDPYVMKIQPSGESLVYDFLVKYGNGPKLIGIAVDVAGCAYVAGGRGYNYLSEFLGKINASGTDLIYSEDINIPGVGGSAWDDSGNVYLIGHDSSSYLIPVTVGPDLTHNGRVDVFVAKISPEYYGYYVFDGNDFDGDGASDIAVFRPSNGFWYLRRIDNDPWGQVNDIPVPGDYNGDGITDMAVWRPSNGVWYLRGIDDDQLGQVGDVPVPADYDGDRRTDLAVWRPSDGTWYIRYRAGGGKTKAWGQTGDFPVPGDYNGDGIADMAVWRPSNGLWYIRRVDTDFLGQEGDIPVPADYDGDGRTDLAVWRPSNGTWHIKYRAGRGRGRSWGMPGDVPAPGDYDGDGDADLAVWRPSTGQWLIKNIDTVTWGVAGDIPLVR